MSRGRPQGDYGQRMPDSGLTGFEPDDRDRRRDDQPLAGRGADPAARAWPYNQEPGVYGARGSADADGDATGTDWRSSPAPQRVVEPWDTPPPAPQRPSGDPAGADGRGRDSWAAGQDFARPWAADDQLGGPRGPGYGNWTPPGPAAAPAPPRASLPAPAPARRPADFSPAATVSAQRALPRDADADQFGYGDTGQRDDRRVGADGNTGRFGAVRRGKDRRSSDRSQGRGPGPAQPAEAADEDYDWIKYRGEGRGGPGPQTPAKPAGRPGARLGTGATAPAGPGPDLPDRAGSRRAG